MGDFEKNVLGKDGEQQAMFDMDALPDLQRTKALALHQWLIAHEEEILTETVRKAVQYGSADLKVLGRAMVLLLPEPLRDDRLALQMGIAFYCAGKVARLFGAFEQGKSPTHDDWFDLEVYAKMGLKVMQTGAWY